MENVNERIPKISVVMPIYNAEQYLPSTLESILNQTIKDIEILCVDDGSTDDTDTVLRHYAGMDSRIRILKQERKYAGNARNHGMKFAKGKYLSFLDADDYFEPTMLEKAYERAEKIGADVVVYGGKQFRDDIENAVEYKSLLNKDVVLGEQEIADYESFPFPLTFTTPVPWNKLFNTQFIKEKHLKYQSSARINDAYFVLLALAEAKRVGVIHEPLVFYRRGNKNSLQGTELETPTLLPQVYLEIKKELEHRGLYDRVKKDFLNLCLIVNFNCLQRFRNSGAFEELYHALKYEYFPEYQMSDIQKEDVYTGELFQKYRSLEQYESSDYKKDLETKDYYIFPFCLLKKDSRIILYGAGRVGQVFFKQIRRTGYCEVVSWVDRNREERQLFNIALNYPNEICKYDYDFILIAIQNGKTAENIIEDLCSNCGVDRGKIVWSDPCLWA